MPSLSSPLIDQHCAVNILLTNPERLDVKPVLHKSIIDTGATCSMILPSIVKSLELDSQGKREIITANGQISLNTYNVNIGIIMPTGNDGEIMADTKKLLVSCYPENEKSSNTPILLGMDFLSHCVLTIGHEHFILAF